MFDIWRKTFSPNCSMYATVSLPPVPVLQPLFFQHLSARVTLTFRSARPRPASAILRCRLLREERGLEERLAEGAGLGLVHLAEAAALAEDRPAPRPASCRCCPAGRAIAEPREQTSARTRRIAPLRLRRLSEGASFASFREPQLGLLPIAIARRSSDDRSSGRGATAIRSPRYIPTMIAAPKTMTQRRRQAQDQQHLRQEGERERGHPGRGRARQPARERRARDDDRGDRREEVGRAERRVDVMRSRRAAPPRRVQAPRPCTRRRRASGRAGRPSTRLAGSRRPPGSAGRRRCSEAGGRRRR